MKKRIVVTGLGVVSSIGIGKDAFWENLLKGKSGISKVSAFDTSAHATHYGGEVKNFNPEQFIDKKKIRFIGRASQLAIAATKMALEDAVIDMALVRRMRAGVCLGTTMGEIQSVEALDHKWIKTGEKNLNELFIFQSSVNSLPANVACEFKLRGINRIFTTACASGNYAIGYGYDLLQAEETDIVLAGGADAFSWIAFTGFAKVGATAEKMCQPFDKNRKGMIPGEGAGMLVLETLDHAKKRGAHIYAEVLGYGLSCDATHMTNPNPEGVAECMNNALSQADIKPEDIDYISAHGTGTVSNDKSECAAIKKVFGARKIAVSSIKSMLGHTMGAASAIEALACCLMVEKDIIAPTINYQTPDPECDIDCVPNVARKQKVEVILNNGFAFGGNNASLVMKKFNN